MFSYCRNWVLSLWQDIMIRRIRRSTRSAGRAILINRDGTELCGKSRKETEGFQMNVEIRHLPDIRMIVIGNVFEWCLRNGSRF